MAVVMLDEGEKATVLKVVFVGDSRVGKTSLIVSYTTNGYPAKYSPTAFDNYSVTVRVDNQPIRLQLGDTAGQAEFDSLRPFSYPDTDVFVLVFNVMCDASLRSIVHHWLPELRLLLVGTQCDQRMNMRRVLELRSAGLEPVSEARARLVADEIGADQYIECSALTQLNLKQVFDAAILTALMSSNCSKSSTRSPTKPLASAGKSDKPSDSKIRDGLRRLISSFTKRLV